MRDGRGAALLMVVLVANVVVPASTNLLRSSTLDEPRGIQQPSSPAAAWNEDEKVIHITSAAGGIHPKRGGGPAGDGREVVRRALRTAVAEDFASDDFYARIPITVVTASDEAESKAAYRLWVANMLLLWLVWMALSVCVYISCYNFRVPLRDESCRADPEDTLENGHCACLGESGDPGILVCACCCPAIRWADTVNLAGLMRVGVAFCLCSLFFLMDGLVLPSLGFGIFFACTLLYYRQQLRRKFGLPYGTCQTCVKDFCFVFWCPWCAIAQEAIAVKQAYEIGHPAVRSGPARNAGGTWDSAPNVQNLHYFVN